MERLKMLRKMNHISVIAILEPFSNRVNIQSFKVQLNMDNATSNSNSKIWVFWNSDIGCDIFDEDEQQITCDMKHNELQYQFTSTFIYAKCKQYLRRPLWDKLLHHTSVSTNPWCAVGDYNVISNVDETLGGLPYNMRKSIDFIAIIEACGLVDIGFSGHRFTWSNKRGINHRIWKRLDRALVNDLWLEKMPQTTITHLSTTGSDHCPLLLEMKTQLQWFKDGDTNSKYFHSIIRRRRRKLFIHQIVTENGDWIQGENNIAQAACEHFTTFFNGEDKHINEHNLECIPRMINQDKNTQLTKLPNMDELKEVVFSMSSNSAAGPDGMNGYFFQKCWNIIKNDLVEVLHAFFNGLMIPKYFSHSCIVLLPKVNNPNKLTEFRPISLSNFTSKIISKLVSNRLGPILPSLISTNQSGFVKGRSISENIMFAKEIIHQIKKPNIRSNVIIKLDMAKAYDRVSWSYICLVLRKMGFNEVFIDMVWTIMANNWFSIIVNGKRYGFFRSTRGLKHGDPLSPALFILGAEQWWIFQTKQTLWGDFLRAKYCQRSNPVSKKWDTGESLTWKHMLVNRQQVEQHIHWRLQAGNCSFWWDKWLGTGPLAQHTSNSNRFNNSTIADFWGNEEWNWSKLVEHSPVSQLSSIMATKIPHQQHMPDQAV
ncbi:uncharacterized protein [Solanum lycopersicum]|uniref:uncharacterized protein n=1 Tax=Solanum lycopersicum TaxID=4081 RepID=UPI00374A1EEE